MARVTRSSGVAPSIESDDDARATTDILNDTAASVTRAPPPKRKRKSQATEQASSPAQKRVRTQTETTEDVAAKSPNRRHSTRLQARKSLNASETLADKRNIFDVPDHDGPDMPAPVPQVPITKTRVLGKKGKDTALILPPKGTGMFITETNARVNLDSPDKRKAQKILVTKKLAKIGVSLQNANTSRALNLIARAAETSRDTSQNDQNNKADQNDEPTSPVPGILATASRGTTSGSSNKASKATAPATKKHADRRECGPLNDESAETNHAAPSPQSTKTRPRTLAAQERPAPLRERNPLAEAAERTDADLQASPPHARSRPAGKVNSSAATETATDHVEGNVKQIVASGNGRGEDEDSDEYIEPEAEELEDASTGGEEIAAPPLVEDFRRPPTESVRRANELAVQEEEARRQDMIAKELAGVEAAVRLHGCEREWTDALLAAAEIVRDKGTAKVRSARGEKCVRYFKLMDTIYRDMADEHPTSRRLTSGEKEMFAELALRCAKLGRYQVGGGQYDTERRKMVQDIYEHLIPRSLRFARSVLRARFHNDNLSQRGISEVCEALKITWDLIAIAQGWAPRPQLENGVKAKVSSDIKPKMDFLLRQYQGILDESGRIKYVEDHASRAAKNRARLEIEHQQWKEARSTQSNRNRGTSRNPNIKVIDIDDILTDEQPTSSSHQGPQASPLNGSMPPTRPQIRREPTEDIPAPSEPLLNENEVDALLRALRRFRHKLDSRWEDIMDRYGSEGGPFEHWDMDQLLEKARWLKQTLTGQLDGELNGDHEWDYLRSVPG